MKKKKKKDIKTDSRNPVLKKIKEKKNHQKTKNRFQRYPENNKAIP